MRLALFMRLGSLLTPQHKFTTARPHVHRTFTIVQRRTHIVWLFALVYVVIVHLIAFEVNSRGAVSGRINTSTHALHLLSIRLARRATFFDAHLISCNSTTSVCRTIRVDCRALHTAYAHYVGRARCDRDLENATFLFAQMSCACVSTRHFNCTNRNICKTNVRNTHKLSTCDNSFCAGCAQLECLHFLVMLSAVC